MKIVVGLGNYGEKYEATYHNMGFLALDRLARKLGIKVKTRECSALTGVGSLSGEKLVLAKPQTYMNLSGVAVKALLKKYKADAGDLIVIFDDIDIERGTVRTRMSGSAGTHNGMRNIISEIGTENFKRVKIGIGRPDPNVPLASYVLSEVPFEDRAVISTAIDNAVEAVEKLLETRDREKDGSLC